MNWKCIHIHTTQEACDIVCSILWELGFEGVEIHDSVPLSEEDRKKLFIDFLPEVDEADHSATITCYMEADGDVEAAVQQLLIEKADYEPAIDFGAFTITYDETKEEDWVNNWKQYFHAFRVDEQIVIKPSWEDAAEFGPEDMIVEIDPGTAFGTGSHETTRLCILNLKKYLQAGDALLDVGCGSGILTIIGRKLGAGLCNAIDIDPIAVAVSKENTALNGLPVADTTVPVSKGEEIAYVAGDLITDGALRKSFGEKKYPVVVANILADIVMPLSSVVGELLAPGGIFITSGILATRAEEVSARFVAEGLEIVEITQEHDWVSIVARAKA